MIVLIVVDIVGSFGGLIALVAWQLWWPNALAVVDIVGRFGGLMAVAVCSYGILAAMVA